MRHKFDSNVRFMLMNSFSTSDDTLAFLKKYPELSKDPNLELMQNKVPKVDAATMEPAEWPQSPSKEWCPPGKPAMLHKTLPVTDRCAFAGIGCQLYLL